MSYVNDQRILMQTRIGDILKKILPMEKDKAVSRIMFEMGMTKDKAREYMKVFFDIGFISYDKKGLIEWKEK